MNPVTGGAVERAPPPAKTGGPPPPPMMMKTAAAPPPPPIKTPTTKTSGLFAPPQSDNSGHDVLGLVQEVAELYQKTEVRQLTHSLQINPSRSADTMTKITALKSALASGTLTRPTIAAVGNAFSSKDFLNLPRCAERRFCRGFEKSKISFIPELAGDQRLGDWGPHSDPGVVGSATSARA